MASILRLALAIGLIAQAVPQRVCKCGMCQAAVEEGDACCARSCCSETKSTPQSARTCRCCVTENRTPNSTTPSKSSSTTNQKENLVPHGSLSRIEVAQSPSEFGATSIATLVSASD